MKITYDKKIDALYIQFKKGRYDHTKKVTDDILVDVSQKDEVLGLEILDASRNMGEIPSKHITLEVSSVRSRSSVAS